jgi:hypothetical protein
LALARKSAVGKRSISLGALGAENKKDLTNKTSAKPPAIMMSVRNFLYMAYGFKV